MCSIYYWFTLYDSLLVHLKNYILLYNIDIFNKKSIYIDGKYDISVRFYFFIKNKIINN